MFQEQYLLAACTMEVSLEPITKQIDEAFDIKSFLPVESSNSVSKDYARSLSKLPMMRNQVELLHLDENQRFRQQDEIMQEHLRPILLEIAEIRNTIKDLAPFLRNSQKYLQAKIFAYARNHTTFSKRVRSIRVRTESFANESHPDFKSFSSPIARIWYRFLHFLISSLMPNYMRKEKDRQKIEDAFKRFYEINGADFRLHLFHGMARCRKLEAMLSNLRLQMTNLNLGKSGDSIAGVAAHVGIGREEMHRWKPDVEYVWKEAKNIRGVFGLLPAHNCWKAIYNIMIGDDKLNLYV